MLGAAWVAALICLWLSRERGRIAALLAGATLVSALLLFVIMRLRPGYHPRYALFLVVPLALVYAEGVGVLLRSTALRVLEQRSCSSCGARSLPTPTISSGPITIIIATTPARQRPWCAKRCPRAASSTSMSRIGRWSTTCAGRRWTCATLTRRLPGCTIIRSPRPLCETALITWHQGTLDPGGALPYALEGAGTLLSDQPLAGYRARVYLADTVARNTKVITPGVRIGPLALAYARWEASAPADEALTLALGWDTQAAAAETLKLAIVLKDAQGHELVQRDALLTDLAGSASPSWEPSTRVETLHVIPLFSAMPPGLVELEVRVYEQQSLESLDVLDALGNAAGRTLALGSIEILPARGVAPPSPPPDHLWISQREAPSPLPPGLADWAVDKSALDPGETLQVQLLWELSALQTTDGRAPAVGVVWDTGMVAVVEASAATAAALLAPQQGAQLLDWRDIPIPVDAPAGEAAVALLPAGLSPIRLQSVTIGSVPRRFEPPAGSLPLGVGLGEGAELYGYAPLPATVSLGEPFEIELHWGVRGESAERYTVFVHLLSADGRVIAQHDGEPAQGARPTSGWRRGEYLVDAHTLTWLSEATAGHACIEVGLYSASTGQRLLTPDGASQVLLPDCITVSQP